MTVPVRDEYQRQASPRKTSRTGGLGAALAAALSLTLIAPFQPETRAEPLEQPFGEVHPVCLLGEWHVVDLLTYSQSAIRAGTIESASGPYYFSFRPDGTFAQTADVTVNATSPLGDRFEQRMLIVASGNYRDSLEAVLAFDGVLSTGSVDVTVNGQPLISGADPVGLTISDGTRAAYECNGDRLTLQPDFGDGRVAYLNLQRHHGS